MILRVHLNVSNSPYLGLPDVLVSQGMSCFSLTCPGVLFFSLKHAKCPGFNETNVLTVKLLFFYNRSYMVVCLSIIVNATL